MGRATIISTIRVRTASAAAEPMIIIATPIPYIPAIISGHILSVGVFVSVVMPCAATS